MNHLMIIKQAETEAVKEGSQYFTLLSRIILQYVEHMENTSEGDIGVLERIKSLSDKTPFIGINNFTLKYKNLSAYISSSKNAQNVVTIPRVKKILTTPRS